MSDINPKSGWIFYDGNCSFCTSSVDRVAPLLAAQGFLFAPMQQRWVENLLGLQNGKIPNEFVVLGNDGRRFGGAKAIVHLTTCIWWARPFAVVLKLPFVFPLVERGYRWVATRRYCISGSCNFTRHEHTPRNNHHAQ